MANNNIHIGISNKKISCCYQCSDREVGCHGTCDEYQKERSERDEEYKKWLADDRQNREQIKLEVNRAYRKKKHFQNKWIRHR